MSKKMEDEIDTKFLPLLAELLQVDRAVAVLLCKRRDIEHTAMVYIKDEVKALAIRKLFRMRDEELRERILWIAAWPGVTDSDAEAAFDLAAERASDLAAGK